MISRDLTVPLTVGQLLLVVVAFCLFLWVFLRLAQKLHKFIKKQEKKKAAQISLTPISSNAVSPPLPTKKPPPTPNRPPPPVPNYSAEHDIQMNSYYRGSQRVV